MSARYSTIGNEILRHADMLDSEGSEKNGNRILNFLRHICINCIACLLTQEKMNFSLCVTRLLRTADLTELCDIKKSDDFNETTHAAIVLAVC
jgi:hypothetical protein